MTKSLPMNSMISPTSMSEVDVDVAQCLDHHEQRVAVALQLGTLVGVDRVLDRQGVELQLVGDLVELLCGRLVQADPHEAAAGLARGVEGVAQVTLDVVARHLCGKWRNP